MPAAQVVDAGDPVRTVAGALPPGSRLGPALGQFFPVSCVSYSADGRWLATGADALMVWDAETGKPVRRLGRNDQWVGSCAFVGSDRLMSVGQRGLLTIWDPAKDEPLAQDQVLPDQENAISLSYRASPLEIAVGGDSGSVVVLDARAGVRRTITQPSQQRNIVSSVGFTDEGDVFSVDERGELRIGPTNPDVAATADESERAAVALGVGQNVGAFPLAGGQLFVSGSQGMKIIDAKGATIVPFVAAAKDEWAVATSKSQDTLASASHLGVSLWSIYGEKLCTRELHGSAFAFSPSGTELAIGGLDGRTTVIDRKCHVVRALGGQRSWIISAQLDRGRAVLGDEAGRVTLWDLRTLSQIEESKWHFGLVRNLGLDGDDMVVSIATDRAIIRGRPGEPGSVVAQLDAELTDIVTLGDGGYVVGTTAGEVRRLRPERGKKGLVDTLLFRAARGTPIHDIELAPSKQHVLVAAEDGVLYQVAVEAPGSKPWATHGTPANDVQYSRYHDLVAAAWDDGYVEVRDAKGLEVLATPRGQQGQLADIGFSKGYLWAAEYQGTVWRWPVVDVGGRASVSETGEVVSSPVDQLDAVQMMTVSEQEGILALSRLDGTLELRDLGDARPLARLIPTHESGWATLKPDGSFVATLEAAKVLLAERASDQKSWTLAEIASGVASNEVVLGTPGVERLQGGVASVKFALSSPAGMPKIKLDGVWDVPAAATSTPGMFEVEYLVRELRPRTQTVRVTGPRGASKELELSIPGDPGFLGQESRHQVLAVGLHEYQNAGVTDLESAANDAKLVAAEFRKPNTWNLDATQSRAELNLSGDALKTVLRKFLLETTADTTLLLFIAGHGDLEGGESVLLPVDYDPGNSSNNLPAELLWGWVKASPAKQVAVVIDACHSGGFGKFQGKLVELAQDPAAQNRVIISSSSRTKPAMSGKSSGNFTSAFIKALSSPSAVDHEVGAITLYQAFAHAQVATIVQRPRMEGGEGLEKLVLATPPAPDNLVASSGKGHDQALSVSYDITQPRQIVARSMFDKVVNDELKLAIKFFEPAERLSIAVFAEGTSSALINYFESARDKAGGPGRWQRSDNLTTKIPLRKLKGRGSGRYRAELRPCAASGQCGPATKLTFDY